MYNTCHHHTSKIGFSKNEIWISFQLNPIVTHTLSFLLVFVDGRFMHDIWRRHLYNIGTNGLGMKHFQYYQDAFLYYIANTCLGEIETQLLFLFSFLISNKKRIYQIELSKKIVTQGNFSVNMQHITINAYPLPILQNNFLFFK